MMIKKLSTMGIGLLISIQSFSQTKLVNYIDTKIGVIDTRGSNCIIGPQLPYASISPSPQTIDGDHDGYHPNRPIRGFGQLHVSGTGWGKYGHFLISPQVGLAVAPDKHDSPKSKEITTAYYYQTNLDRYNIVAGVAPTHHAALYQFTYPKTDSAYIVLDATQSIADFIPKLGYKFRKCDVEILPEKNQIRASIECSGGWAYGYYKLYFIAQFNKSFSESGVWKDNTLKKGEYAMSLDKDEGQRVGTFCRFKTQQDDKILMKASISFSGFENAEKYLNNEIKGWNIEDVEKAGMLAWENKLQHIKIETNSEAQKKIFYTAMYHTMIQPRDRTGDNPNWKSNAPYWDDNYALWDTWRSAFPLFMLIDQDMVRGNIQCFVDRYKHNGAVRDGFVAGIEMEEEQGGNDVDNVIADAYVKGLKGVNWQEVYGLVKYNAEKERKGLVARNQQNPEYKANNGRYKELGWIPECFNSNSNTLEYAYNDFCVAQLAKGLGETADYEKFIKRSKGWTNLWNPNLESDGFKGFIDAKKADGSFINQDAKMWGKSWVNPFYEGTSWTYSYFVPHDINRLIKLVGGKEMYAKRLEYGMNNKLIDYGNEPSFWALRSFNHAGRPDLTSKWVHWILNKNYDTTGYTGNDDTGAMTSWYILSAVGLFPNAGQDIYYLNAPLYKKSVITLSNGKKLSISANNLSAKNIYIKSCKVNGKPWNSSVIRHKDIANGATIEFELAAQAGNWGK
ncbi:alpha-mannosidase [Pedobacter petrophilus]|uniref:Alpha-mannosidase n=1 Tax=Pedobacter petrophilus TaxID=1908241 RepID=A0A7K0G052_9SPHI|nr:GH92 family glycosyl hydrolase [Pedobacter petrophilus]MRX76982.1 alpha-mannosidase [Pedobacter petrophilus]